MAGHLTVEGVSVAGQETCIVIPQLKVIFDIGRCPQRAVSFPTLLVSHAHMDHIGGVLFHAGSRNMTGQAPTRVHLPAESRAALDALFAAQRHLDGGTELPYDAVPLSDASSRIPLGNGLSFSTFKTFHVVPSVGYTIFRTKEKLLPEFHGLPASEIKRLKKQGVCAL